MARPRQRQQHRRNHLCLSRKGTTQSPHPRGRDETPEGIAQEVELDQDGNEVVEEDEDGEITEQARDLRKLDQCQQDIARLQREEEQLLQQAAA